MLTNLKKLAIRKSPKIQSFPLSKKTCFDAIALEDFSIDKYIKGEFISEDYPNVSEEEARKRLVFFVGQMDNLQAYCSDIDYLEQDLNTSIYSGNCQNSNIHFEQGKFTHVIYKLNFGYPVYVMLEDFLGTILESGKQIFALIPSYKKYDKTQSLDVFLGGSYVSADHCQDGSDKRIYDIITCSDKDEWCVKHSDGEQPLTEEQKTQQQREIDIYLSSRRNERLPVLPPEIGIEENVIPNMLINDPFFSETMRLINSLKFNWNQEELYNHWRNRLLTSGTIEEVIEINEIVRFMLEFFRKTYKYDIPQDRRMFTILVILFNYYYDRNLFTSELRETFLDNLTIQNIRIFRDLYPSQVETMEKLSRETMTTRKLRKIAKFYGIDIQLFIRDDFAIKSLIIDKRNLNNDIRDIDTIIEIIERLHSKSPRRSRSVSEEIVIDDEDENSLESLRSLGITRLKALAKEKGIRGFSRFTSANKEELVQLIFNSNQGSSIRSSRSPSKSPRRSRSVSEEIVIDDEDENSLESLRSLGITRLKALAKEKGIRGFSRFTSANKEELVQLIFNNQDQRQPNELDILNSLGITELKRIAKEKGIRGFSRFTSANKNDLAQLIYENM